MWVKLFKNPDIYELLFAKYLSDWWVIDAVSRPLCAQGASFQQTDPIVGSKHTNNAEQKNHGGTNRTGYLIIKTGKLTVRGKILKAVVVFEACGSAQ